MSARSKPFGPRLSGAGSARALVALILFVVLLVELPVLAQSGLPMRRIGVWWNQGVPHLSVSIADIADDRVRRSLSSGLRKTLVVTAQAYLENNDRLLAQWRRSCSVTYDLWEETFVVRVGRRATVHRSIAEVLDACAVVRQVPLGSVADYEEIRGRRVYFAFRAEFNPISPQRCRRLLGNAGSDDPIGPVVVNIVRREICQAERAVDLRSQAVTVP